MTNVEELISIVQELPQEAVDDLLQRAQTWSQKPVGRTHYVPVTLGGLWQGVEISDKDIQATRAEMWQTFGERK